VNDGELLNSGIEFDVTAHLLKAMIILLTSVNGELRTLKMPIDPATGEKVDRYQWSLR
jgi:hypothetical protein